MIKDSYSSPVPDAFWDDLPAFQAFSEDQLHFNLQYYKAASVKRRLKKILDYFQLEDLPALQRFLEARNYGRSMLIRHFVVHYSQWFREPESLKFICRFIEKQIRSQSKPFKIWLCGCSRGEEVLSLCICLAELQLLEHCQILATDIDGEILDKDQMLKLPIDDFANAEQRYRLAGGKQSLEIHRNASADFWQVNEALLAKVELTCFDLTRDEQAPDQFDLVWCKNVLIYFTDRYHPKIAAKLYNSLKHSGILCLGEQEFISALPPHLHFLPLSSELKIYQKG